jgi:hypothetical protein
MGRGWLLSSLLHAALAAVLWFGLPGWSRPLPAIESGITVELVSEAELGPPEPEVAALAPEPAREAARPEPTPPAPEPEPVAEPEPEPEPAPVTPPPPEPEPVVEPEPVQAEPEPAPVAEPEPPPEPEVARPEPEPAPPPEPEPEVARPEPDPAPPPEPEPEPEQQAALEPEPPPEPAPSPPAARPKPAAKPAPPPAAQPRQPEAEPKPAAPPQAKAAPEPAPPEPPEPEPPEEDDLAWLRSVEETIERKQAEIERAGTGRAVDAAGQARTRIGDGQMTQAEMDALNRQIRQNWILPAGAADIEDVVVQLRIEVGPDRSVRRVTIQDQARLERDPTFRAVAESAYRAVERSSPLQLPPDKYSLWHDLVLNFSPQDLIRG